MIEVVPLISGPLRTNAYLLINAAEHVAAIIDPALGSASQILSILHARQLTPQWIALTHSHWDHIADVQPLKSALPIPVYVHQEDEKSLIEPDLEGLPRSIHIEGVQPDILFSENDTLILGKSCWRVLHTPGHSPGSVCLYEEHEGILLSGDTLFKGTIGNISFPESDPDSMWASLKKLALLPKETKVFPGHGPATTIGQEDWLSHPEEHFG